MNFLVTRRNAGGTNYHAQTGKWRKRGDAGKMIMGQTGKRNFAKSLRRK
jgi:hypothetical protein